MPRSNWKTWEEVPDVTHDDLHDLTPCQSRKLRIAMEIIRNSRGCVTPFENFFSQLTFLWLYGRTTPDQVEEEFVQFRKEFDSMSDQVVAFNRTYGEYLQKRAAEKQAEAALPASGVKKSPAEDLLAMAGAVETKRPPARRHKKHKEAART